MSDLGGFLGELASSSPTPGGGSTAALSGALAAALVSMVCNLTIGKKKYADIEQEMRRVLKNSESLRLELTQLIEEDASVFNGVMAALRLPKDTEEQKAKRKATLETALVDAATVPLAVMEKCVAVAKLARTAGEKGNTNAVSDAGVAALLARAGAHAARLNVEINLPGIKSEKHRGFVESAQRGLTELSREADSEAQGVLEVVAGKL